MGFFIDFGFDKEEHFIDKFFVVLFGDFGVGDDFDDIFAFSGFTEFLNKFFDDIINL